MKLSGLVAKHFKNILNALDAFKKYIKFLAVKNIFSQITL